ncbi:hypothetical protein [Paenibacillus macquariensis]|uniref:Uncharacterized protein n=1 Tax=Paenibacillus macquariensis TaxID=948756 RepID=A0ABY1K1E6_9BACL|nr:hypothetical protein [Paenibacillus macquariensis]MEC0091790.1 hypothetical protein [Paenibacillus macquariensis]SIR11923.1 hypothetical protein SAMN05421578_107125 [Paenibacillus macquariensis]
MEEIVDIKIIKKKVGDAIITKPILVGKESEDISDYKEDFIAVHQAFFD